MVGFSIKPMEKYYQSIFNCLSLNINKEYPSLLKKPPI